VTPFILPNI